MPDSLKNTLNVIDDQKIENRTSNNSVIRMLKYSVSLNVAILVTICSLFFIYHQFLYGPKGPISLIGAIICALFEGGVIGVIIYKNIIEFHKTMDKELVDEDQLEKDALFNYLKVNEQNYSTDTFKLLKSWKSSNDAKEKNKLMKLISSQINEKTADEKPLDERSETAYLNIIGGLLAAIQDKSLSESNKGLFGNQSAIVQTLLNKFDGVYGISQTNLDAKFAKANQSIKSK